MSLRPTRHRRLRRRFPRVSGDEPTAFVKLGYLSEFSPRERG